MIRWQDRIRLSELDELLDQDHVFAEAAMGVLGRECPLSTYTTATAGTALLDYWLVQRDLTCYERGRVLDDVTVITVFADINGDFSASIHAIDHDLYIDRQELLALINEWRLPKPFRLTSDIRNEEVRDRKLLKQEKLILDELKKRGFNPKALPKNEIGKSGVKAEVSAALKKHTLFEGPTTFNKAWERLRRCRDIEDTKT